MGKGKSPPPPPDPKETAAAQTGTNVATAVANAHLGNVSQITPYGNLTYDTTGSYSWTDPSTGDTYDIPTFTATQTPGPGGQEVVDNTIDTKATISRIGKSQANRIENVLNDPLSADGLTPRARISDITAGEYTRAGPGPNLADNLSNRGEIATSFDHGGKIQDQIGDAGQITRSYGTDFSADRKRVEDALMSRLNPSLERDRRAMQANLASQGIRIGSEAYKNAMDGLGRQSNDARMQAILAGGQEHSRLVGLEANRAAFENASQAQQHGQNVMAANFANDAQARRFGQNLAAAEFANRAQSEDFRQLTGINAALSEEHRNALSASEINNNLVDREFNRDIATYNATNAERDAELNERATLRNQPLNEISALMSGSQLQAPRFHTVSTPSIPTTDYAGLVNASHQNELDAWQTRQNSRDNMFGMLGGLGKAYIGTL